MKRICLGAILTAAAMLSAPVAAQTDISARYEMGEDHPSPMNMEMTFEVAVEGHVRLQMGNLPAYYLLRDDVLYSVTNGPDGPVVIRVADHMILQEEFAEQMFTGDWPEPAELPEWRFAPIGEEVVEGRTGTAYGIVPEGAEEPGYALMVIGAQPELAPLGAAMQRTNEVMMRNVPSAMASLARANDDMQAVIATGAPLRISGLVLTDVSLEDIPEDRFVLPAEPLTIEQLRASLVPFDPPPTLPAPDE